MSLSFREYLANRRTRYSPGSEEFLKTLARDDNFAAVATRHELDAYLMRSEVSANGKVYARQVWNSYLIVRKRRERSQTRI